MDYYYEDIYSSKNVFMRYYYKSKNNDEASRIFKQQYPINGISKIIGVRTLTKNKNALISISYNNFIDMIKKDNNIMMDYFPSKLFTIYH